MDRESRRRFEEYRQEAGPVENNLIDELLDGEVDRGEFIRRGTMFGLSASVIGTCSGQSSVTVQVERSCFAGRPIWGQGSDWM